MALEPLRKWSFGRTFTSVREILLRFGQNRHSSRASFCYLISNISQSHGNFRQIFYFFQIRHFRRLVYFTKEHLRRRFARVAIFAIAYISGLNWKNCPLKRGDLCLYLSGTMIKCLLMIGFQC